MTKKTFPFLSAAILLVNLQVGCANAPATAKDDAPKAASTAVAKNPFPELKVGMTADQIRAKLGDPVEVRPMESKTGKAEVWTFHLERTVNTTQVATSTRDVPAFALNTVDKLTTYPDMVYSLADQTAVTILSLLMVDGRLIAQTSATGQRTEYK